MPSSAACSAALDCSREAEAPTIGALQPGWLLCCLLYLAAAWQLAKWAARWAARLCLRVPCAKVCAPEQSCVAAAGSQTDDDAEVFSLRNKLKESTEQQGCCDTQLDNVLLKHRQLQKSCAAASVQLAASRSGACEFGKMLRWQEMTLQQRAGHIDMFLADCWNLDWQMHDIDFQSWEAETQLAQECQAAQSLQEMLEAEKRCWHDRQEQTSELQQVREEIALMKTEIDADRVASVQMEADLRRLLPRPSSDIPSKVCNGPPGSKVSAKVKSNVLRRALEFEAQSRSNSAIAAAGGGRTGSAKAIRAQNVSDGTLPALVLWAEGCQSRAVPMQAQLSLEAAPMGGAVAMCH